MVRIVQKSLRNIAFDILGRGSPGSAGDRRRFPCWPPCYRTIGPMGKGSILKLALLRASNGPSDRAVRSIGNDNGQLPQNTIAYMGRTPLPRTIRRCERAVCRAAPPPYARDRFIRRLGRNPWSLKMPVASLLRTKNSIYENSVTYQGNIYRWISEFGPLYGQGVFQGIRMVLLCDVRHGTVRVFFPAGHGVRL